ncbi:DUF1998 domain-containing protein [Flavobacterium sp.]|uniref:DUF1998 domain-containing protein n=1 Tax=Flavobacterium sp. TaxID=239 RepID=UPI002B4B5730|nr:DUF1998 domain-containing protein [Flavobacterium sp.]HLF52570.1 DUF1998 domain-containing protein [Flavobacterium sp.]
MSKKNNVRSGQMLSPFGIGQIVNLPEEVSVMVCGLSLWDEKIKQGKINRGSSSIDEGELRFNELRLEKVLGVEYFVKPFEYKTSGSKNNYLEIPAVRFPSWHYCTNARCGRMREEALEQPNKKIECIACWDQKSNYKSKMIPVRFVAACPSGHIQDVPFKEWVHNGPVPNDNKRHDLSYHTGGGSGDLGSIILKCTCGESRSLAGLMNIRKEGESVSDSALARIGFNKEDEHKFDQSSPNNENPTGQYCKGHRPWLGLEGINDAQSCDRKHLQVLIRGASNVHFSDIQSAIYLPQVSAEANQYVVELMNSKKTALSALYSLNKDMLRMILASEHSVTAGLISIDELYNGVIAEFSNENLEDKNAELPAELKLRFEEYEYILAGRDSENSDFKAVIKRFEDYLEKDLLEKYFDCVVLVEKLKETRVFKGFSRINPSNKFDKRELSNEPVKWLPAVEVYGEGIFLKFKDDIVDEWLGKHHSAFSNIIKRYHSAQLKRRPQDEPKNLNPFFIAMHTFAHLLIKKLCFECGYGSSSLRERLYFSDDPKCRMNGILIYTSSGDSEGSLGGLVRQGKAKNLGILVKNAIADAEWCSADPVCSDIGQSSGQGPDNVNGSACHNCCIVPETSCEEFNMLLDRSAVIGTVEKKIGFFNKI